MHEFRFLNSAVCLRIWHILLNGQNSHGLWRDVGESSVGKENLYLSGGAMILLQRWSLRRNRRGCAPGSQIIRPPDCDLKWPLMTYKPLSEFIIIIIIIITIILIPPTRFHLNSKIWLNDRSCQSYTLTLQFPYNSSPSFGPGVRKFQNASTDGN